MKHVRDWTKEDWADWLHMICGEESSEPIDFEGEAGTILAAIREARSAAVEQTISVGHWMNTGVVPSADKMKLMVEELERATAKLTQGSNP